MGRQTALYFGLIGLFWSLLGVAYAGQVSPLQVVDLRFGTVVENRELQEEGKLFPYEVGRVYAWTLVQGAEQPTTITHVWYVDEKKVAEVQLPIRYKRHRTWSSKKIWPGEWRVEVLDAEGNLLAMGTFTVEK
ncbi:MAG: DUF2914 domain-containing protein [Nitrospinota bacterium]|nr:MAG: DUF2914 domain-containing protein [Nitrospinota bacterium]